MSSILLLNKKTLLLPKIDRKMSFHAERVEKVYEIDKINIVYNEKLNIVEIHSSFSNVEIFAVFNISHINYKQARG